MVAAGGGRVTDEAIGVMAVGCGGNAYKMQHIGHNAWIAADAPGCEIGVDAAHEAVEAAQRAVYEDVFRPLWEDLTGRLDANGAAVPGRAGARCAACPVDACFRWDTQDAAAPSDDHGSDAPSQSLETIS